MSSSDVRIIKDAKISRDPVVIAMHKFSELNATELLTDDIADEVEDQSKGAVVTPVINNKAEQLIQEAKIESENLLTAAEKEIARMKAQALEEATELKLQAIEEGKNQGLEEARRQIEEKLKQTTEGCNSMMSAALQEARQVVLEADRQIIELVLVISRKIISDAMEDRPELIVGIVKSALGRVRDQSQINIHVNLDDYERILQSRRELQVIVGAERALAITADSMLGQGGCLIETSFGTVEAGIDTQFESIRKALQEMLP